jgi:hypothetical protein
LQDLCSAKVDLFNCCVLPAGLRISYDKDVIVFAERQLTSSGEKVTAVFEGTGLARPQVESF